MNNSHEPSALLRYSGFLFFFVMSLGVFIWFGWGVFQLASQIKSNTPAIILDKGALYMLGTGVVLSALTYGILHEVILKRTLTEKVTKIITRSALAGVGLMVIFPQIVHYPVEHHLLRKGYQICDQASYQWLLYRKIVYVSSPAVCANLIKKNK